MYRLLALLLLASCSQPLPIVDPSAARHELLHRALDAVVVIAAETPEGDYNAFCSGVSVRGGLVMTAYHCVDGEHDLAVAQRGNPDWYIPVDVVFTDPAEDFAIVRPRGIMAAYVDVSREDPIYADRVLVIGHPSLLRWSLSEGIVSFPRREGGGVTGEQTWTQFTATVDPGSSGGALLNARGELIGIVSFGIRHFYGAVHRSVLEHGLAEVSE